MLSERGAKDKSWTSFVLQSMRKRKVLFKTPAMSQPQQAQQSGPAQPSPSDRLDDILSASSSRLEEITDDDDSDDFEDMDEESPKGEVVPDLADFSLKPKTPALYSHLPPLVDTLKTKTSEDQQETVKSILPYHTSNPTGFDLNSHGVPHLVRKKHLEYAEDGLTEYPAQFVVIDASRPWIPYWSLFAISVLGGDTSKFREG